MHIDSFKLLLVLLYFSKSRTVPMFDVVTDKNFEEVLEACCKFQMGSKLAMVVYTILNRNLILESCWYYHQINADSPLAKIFELDLHDLCKEIHLGKL